MTEKKRNILVALFVLAGMAALGWMVFKFGELPVWLSRYDAREVHILFSTAPGIHENSQVLFRGYPVGRVVKMSPPELLADLENPQLETYQIEIVAAIDRRYNIPKNAVPKVFSRGLGSSFLEFALPDNVVPSKQLIADGDKIQGRMSEASEFLSEKTQRKLDDLIASLTALSVELRSQLTPMPPEKVDQPAEGETMLPNITTAVIRLDRTLKSFNTIVSDPENQQNLKTGLADFAALGAQLRQLAEQASQTVHKIRQVVERSEGTVENIDQAAVGFRQNVQQIGSSLQNASDQLAATLKHLDEIIISVSKGEGTTGRLLTDPRLYESLTDTTDKLKITLDDFRELITKWKEKGLLAK
jgi:ABC-type transporter Mla subunit MlaD